MTKAELISKASECAAMANDPNTPEAYRTYIRLEAQHWRTKAENPDAPSYLDTEDRGFLIACAIGGIAYVVIVFLYATNLFSIN